MFGDFWKAKKILEEKLKEYMNAGCAISQIAIIDCISAIQAEEDLLRQHYESNHAHSDSYLGYKGGSNDR